MKKIKNTVVVFVDDDKVQLMINKRVLGKLNLKLDVYFFQNPLEALHWLGENDVDVLMLDINMPEMDGWSFLEQMKLKGIKGDVKMLTASIDPEDLNKSKKFDQISGILIKPIKEEDYLKFLID
ncbi:response regulator [uncultured Cyclobacterium sp.]|uniref:response regulator n=1 Tax=uncultured Cyclobacterium sp. TaxID=453820 RepID=UPI0030EEC86C